MMNFISGFILSARLVFSCCLLIPAFACCQQVSRTGNDIHFSFGGDDNKKKKNSEKSTEVGVVKVNKKEDDDDDIKIGFNAQWKFILGDSNIYASPYFNDSSWHKLKKEKDGEEVTLNNDSLLKDAFGIVWFRTWIDVDSGASGVPLGLFVRQKGSAAEFFLDGKLLESFGKVGHDLLSEEALFNINPKPFPLVFSNPGKHLVAVRFSSFHTRSDEMDGEDRGFDIEFSDLQNNLHSLLDKNVNFPVIALFAIYLTLGVVHLVMFSYFRSNRLNGYFGLFCISISFFLFSVYYSITETDYEIYTFLNKSNFYIAPLLVVTLIALYHTIYYQKLLKLFWILFGLYVVSAVSSAFDFELKEPAFGIFIAIALYEVFRVHIRSIIKRRDGAWILGMGVLYFPLSIILIMIYGIFINDSLDESNKNLGIIAAKTLGYSLTLSVPFSITLYLSRNFARINKKLLNQVEEIKSLSDQTIAHEKEKKEILEKQNVILETKVIERTRELADKNEVILLKNREITDNLNYAKRIQAALLPEIKDIKAVFRDCFILYEPKDIVSGDFYAFFNKGDKQLLAAVDCTGHGVSGAFMSMIGNAALNQIINIGNVLDPAEVLVKLNEEIVTSLNQKSGSSNDGMDIALCCFDLGRMKLEFAGANRPLWIVRNNEIIVLAPDKLPIGGLQFDRGATFTLHHFNLVENDCLYMFSDGFADQFGGEKGKKMMTKKLKEILKSINGMEMEAQHKFLRDFLISWKGENEQLDDILVMGIRI